MTSCTVCIPVHNRAGLIGKAVESALAQNLSDYEVLGIDNCSTDDTWDVLGSYRDPRFRRVKNSENLGLFGNLNRCVELAQGKYLRILCSDDRLARDCLVEEIALMERHPNVSLLSTRGEKISDTEAHLGWLGWPFPTGIYDGPTARLAWFSFFANYTFNPLNYPSGVLFRRSALVKAMPFDESLGAIADIDVYLRTLEHGDLAISDSLGCFVMFHHGQESSAVFAAGGYIDAARNLVERYREMLLEAGIYNQIQRRFAALPTGWAIKQWHRFGPEIIGKFSAYGDGWGTILPMVARLLFMRLLLVTTGLHFTPYLNRIDTLPNIRRGIEGRRRVG